MADEQAQWLPRTAVAAALGARVGLVDRGIAMRTLLSRRTVPWTEVAAVSVGAGRGGPASLPGVRLCVYGPASIELSGLPRRGPRRIDALRRLAEAADRAGVAVVASPARRSRLVGVPVDRWAELDVRADGTWIVVGDAHQPLDYVVGTEAERRARRRQMRSDPRRLRR